MKTVVVIGGILALSGLAGAADFTCGKVIPEMVQLAPGAVKPTGWLKDAAGVPLELIPYGLAKFRITMFPL